MKSKMVAAILAAAVLLLSLTAMPAGAETGYMNLVAYLTQDDVFGTEKVTLKNGADVKHYNGMVVLILNMRGDESGARLIGINDTEENESIDFYGLTENQVLETAVILCNNWENLSGFMEENTRFVIMFSMSENTEPAFIMTKEAAESFVLWMSDFVEAKQ